MVSKIGLKAKAVLVNGLNVRAKSWDDLILGKDEKSGRATLGIIRAVQERASLLFWGSGATEKEGLKESEYTYQKVTQKCLDSLARKVKMSPDELKRRLDQISFFDVVTKNTRDEVRAALSLCQEREIKELLIISTPGHNQRAHLIAAGLKEEFPAIRIVAESTEVCYEGTTIDDVTIVEPHHIPELAYQEFNKEIKAIFPLMRDPKAIEVFNERWPGFIQGIKEEADRRREPPA